MPRRAANSDTESGCELPAPPPHVAVGSHGGAGSSMLHTTVSSDESEQIEPTEPAAPSPTNATRTSDSLPPAAPSSGEHASWTIASSHSRDPNRYQVLGEH